MSKNKWIMLYVTNDFLSFSSFWGNIAKELEKIFLFSLADVRLFFTRDGQSGTGIVTKSFLTETGTKIYFWTGSGPRPKTFSSWDRDQVVSSPGPKMTGPAHVYSLLYYWGVMKEEFFNLFSFVVIVSLDKIVFYHNAILLGFY
jgi:hypothetical protein